MRHPHVSRLTASGGVALLAALTLAGCGGGGSGFGSNSSGSSGSSSSTHAAAEVLYVADVGNNNIPVISLSANGTPSQLGNPATLPTGSTYPLDVILDPSRKFVLVANLTGTQRLCVYQVQANGGLPATPTQSVTLPSLSIQATSGLAALTTANGEFVYVSGSAVDTISVFQLNTSTGVLTLVPNAVPTTGPGASQTPETLAAYTLSQGNSSQPYLLVGDESPSVTNYAVNADGTLTDTGVAEAGNVGPVFVAAPPNVTQGTAAANKVYAYDNGNGEFYTYQVGANGVLTEANSFGTGYEISSFSIYPTGGALYLTQFDGTHVYEYTVDPTTGTPPTTPTQTTLLANAEIKGAALDAAGQFLGVLDATAAAPRVVVYALNGKSVVSPPLASYGLSANANPVAVASNLLQQSF